MQKSFQLNSKYLLVLVVVYIAIATSADAVAYKFTNLGFLTLSGSALIYPADFFINDIIAEVYGYSIIRKVIWLGLFAEIIFALLVQGVIFLPSPIGFHFQTEFHDVLGSTLRFVLSGIVADLVGMFLNAYIMSKCKIIVRGKYFVLRSLGSTFLGQFFMLFIIIALAYYGVTSTKEWLKLFFSIYLFHTCYDLLLVLPAWMVSHFLKNVEKIDVYDYNVKYNPFRVNL